jgi:hypothetical protein
VPARDRDRVAPPAKPGGWEARFATNDAAKGWEQLCQTASANTYEAWVALTEHPILPANPRRQHRLKGALGVRMVHGKALAQWQYEVTASGRIWYCPDPERRIVWLTLAGPGHPKASD